MIEYQKGNLLDADVEALVNTVNCVGIMGKGIALQFKKAFSDKFFQEYERACRAGEVHLGQMFIVSLHRFTNPRYIINFPTKYHWKEKSRLENIKKGLESLVTEVKRLGIRSIALPPLGCGNGGLEWSQVAPMIETAFAELPEVYVLVFEPQGPPIAESMPVKAKKPKMTRARALYIRLMDLYGIPGYTLSMLEIQKLAYFLQLSGEILRLRFIKEKYGPYADNLNHVLQVLDGHYIIGYGDRSVRAEIHLLPQAVEDARLFLADFPEAGERLERVRQLIEGFESPYGMELLATISWIAQEDPQAITDVSRAILGVQEWSAHKRESFKPEHIRKAWKRLSEMNWLNQTNDQNNSHK